MLRLIMLISISVVSACGFKDGEGLEAHLKTFDHILTDQYIWGYGTGGIYWVSNNEIVLEAHIKNKRGEFDRGLYQVDIRDGSFLKVVDVPEKGPFFYIYCFDGKTLNVMRSRGTFTQTNPVNGYQVEIRDKGELDGRNDYSAFRCGFVENPFETPGFKPLRKGDGYLRFHTDQNNEMHVYMADETGINVKKLISQKEVRKGSPVGLFSIKYYLESKNAYFGYSPWGSSNCTELWWLYREDRRVEHKQLCLGKKAFGSRVIHSLNGALYLEHHTDEKGQPKSYVLFKEGELSVEKEKIRGSSVSPDGCKVAYAVDNDNAPVRQKLKLFNYCDYKEKGANSK